MLYASICGKDLDNRLHITSHYISTVHEELYHLAIVWSCAFRSCTLISLIYEVSTSLVYGSTTAIKIDIYRILLSSDTLYD